jgi:membrane-bound lytic murein transglycosylase A
VHGGFIGCADRQLAETPPVAGPNYAKPLPAGHSALRLVTDEHRLPDIAAAAAGIQPGLVDAIDESLVWFAAPSSKRHYPFEGITHEQARAGLLAMRELVTSGASPQRIRSEILRKFDVFESVGYNGAGTVLFTGYYSPVFNASLSPTGAFMYPLYTRPSDLATDPDSGAPLGRRRADGTIEPYPTRREIETSGMLAGNELVWLKDPLEVYMVHVNGSAKLRLHTPGGDLDAAVMFIGYAGKTDHPYTGLGQSMIDEGMLADDGVSLAAVKREYRRYVFFTEYDGASWPAGSLGVRVTAKRSLATDKKIYPRGGLVLVDTEAISFAGSGRPFLQFMLDQDTGGAIQAPGRADIFMGIGSGAEILAGGQYAEGRLYYFVLKPE